MQEIMTGKFYIPYSLRFMEGMQNVLNIKRRQHWIQTTTKGKDHSIKGN